MLLFFIYIFKIMCMHVCLCVGMCTCVQVPVDQERAVEPLELEWCELLDAGAGN